MARPKKDINPDQVEALAGINCTVDEIATVLHCDKRTLERRFAANIKRGRENGRSSLRRMMWEKAKSGNTTMMIWLSKNILGYSDKIEQKTEDKPKIIEIKWGDDDANKIGDASSDTATEAN